MTTSNVDPVMPLQVQIDAIEHNLQTHRSQIRADLNGIGQKLRARLTAPRTLLVAAAVGVVVEQGSGHRAWSLAPLLRGLSVANTLFVTLTPLLKSLNAPSSP